MPRRRKQQSLTGFSRGESGFKQGDLDVFRIEPDGKVDAHPNAALIGENALNLADSNGMHFAEEMVRVAQDGKLI